MGREGGKRNVYDLLIRGGTVVDGSGDSAVPADVAILDGKIAAVAPRVESGAARVIDAAGRLVTPGFIDIHRHADVRLFSPDFGEAELHQGLTTVVNGNCGLSAVPCPAARRDEIHAFLQPVIGDVNAPAPFETFAEYLALVRQTPLPLNVGMLVGNGTVRAAVRGYAPGVLTPGELAAARGLLEDALANGALGVSMGIVYAPEYCYDADGFAQVLAPVRGAGVPLVTHVRGEGDTFHQSLDEVIDVARRLGAPLHVSHFKCIGRRNWGHGMTRALEILDEARESGLRVDCDVYPYTAGSTQLLQILPPWFLDGGAPAITRRLRDPAKVDELRGIFAEPSGRFENLVNLIGWENIRCTTFTRPENQAYTGMSVAKIAAARGEDPCACACRLLAEEECRISMVDFITSEEDIRAVLRYPYSNVISDAVYPSGGTPHPRLYAAFPKVLIDYVRREPVLTLEQAVHKMTARPASVLGLRGKGLLRKGYDADINVFELGRLAADASYENPSVFASGFDYVFVGGAAAVEHDRITGVRAGRVVTR